MEPAALLNFSVEFNNNTYYLGMALQALFVCWAAAAAGGAIWAAIDAPRRNASRAVWAPVVLLCGPLGLAVYAARVRGSRVLAAALFFVLFLLPAAWAGMLMKQRHELYRFMSANFKQPVPLELPAAGGKDELLEAANQANAEAGKLLEDAKKAEAEMAGKAGEMNAIEKEAAALKKKPAPVKKSSR